MGHFSLLWLQFLGLCVYAINADSFPATSLISLDLRTVAGDSVKEEIFHSPPSLRLGSFNNDDGDGNGNGNEDLKKEIGMISKTTTLHVNHAFLVHSR